MVYCILFKSTIHKYNSQVQFKSTIHKYNSKVQFKSTIQKYYSKVLFKSTILFGHLLNSFVGLFETPHHIMKISSGSKPISLESLVEPLVMFRAKQVLDSAQLEALNSNQPDQVRRKRYEESWSFVRSC